MKTADNHPGNHLQYSTAEAYEKSQQQQQQQQQMNTKRTTSFRVYIRQVAMRSISTNADL